jgi:hypothetical protein
MNKIFKSKTRGDYLGSFRFLSKKYNQTGKKRPETEPKPAGFGLVFYPKNRKNLYAFFLDFFGFISTVSPRKN